MRAATAAHACAGMAVPPRTTASAAHRPHTAPPFLTPAQWDVAAGMSTAAMVIPQVGLKTGHAVRTVATHTRLTHAHARCPMCARWQPACFPQHPAALPSCSCAASHHASPPTPPLPQGMSYANLAGLPYAFGLYGAFVPCIVYALLGSSRQLVSGRLERLHSSCACASAWVAMATGPFSPTACLRPCCFSMPACPPRPCPLPSPRCACRPAPPHPTPASPPPLPLAGGGPRGCDLHPAGQRPARLHALPRGAPLKPNFAC